MYTKTQEAYEPDTSMSVFGRASFSAAGYAAARPSYPASLFRTVLSYHGDAARDVLLDLGCGHGLVARAMASHFSKIVAMDTSAGMIRQAASTTAGETNISFCQGGAEDMSLLAEGSVDMVVAGQSAHWFDFTRAWPELARVVRPGGCLAFWGYRDNVLVGHAGANRIMDRFCYAEGEVAPGVWGMQAFWEQPGRNRVRNLMRDVEPPATSWHDVQRLLCDVQVDSVQGVDGEPAWMKKRISLGELEAYVRTFSAFQGWRDAHGQVKSRAEQADDSAPGDLVDLMMDAMVASEPAWQALGDGWKEAEAETVWGSYVLMARRR